MPSKSANDATRRANDATRRHRRHRRPVVVMVVVVVVVIVLVVVVQWYILHTIAAREPDDQLDMSFSASRDYLAFPSDARVQSLNTTTVHQKTILYPRNTSHLMFMSGSFMSKAPAGDQAPVKILRVMLQ